MSNSNIDPRFDEEWFKEEGESSVENSQVIELLTYIESLNR